MNKVRCDWVPLNSKLYKDYHDNEWGIAVHNDQKLFELLILEGAQAGLSWSTVLNKRENYRKAFDNFDFEKVSKYNQKKIEQLLLNSGIVRNKLKIASSIQNAKVFIKIRKEYGSFDKYLWNFVNDKPIINHFENLKEIPVRSDLSDNISKDLKKRGMSFVGSTIIYAYLQAVGVINDHQVKCFRYG